MEIELSVDEILTLLVVEQVRQDVVTEVERRIYRVVELAEEAARRPRLHAVNS
jgi:hypothetical protein